jgi:hypothetical protein
MIDPRKSFCSAYRFVYVQSDLEHMLRDLGAGVLCDSINDVEFRVYHPAKKLQEEVVLLYLLLAVLHLLLAVLQQHLTVVQQHLTVVQQHLMQVLKLEYNFRV